MSYSDAEIQIRTNSPYEVFKHNSQTHIPAHAQGQCVYNVAPLLLFRYDKFAYQLLGVSSLGVFDKKNKEIWC